MQDEDPTVPDEVGTELDAVQVVGVGALLVEHHLLQLLPILPWSRLQSDCWEENSDHDVVIKLVVDDNGERRVIAMMKMIREMMMREIPMTLSM